MRQGRTVLTRRTERTVDVGKVVEPPKPIATTASAELAALATGAPEF